MKARVWSFLIAIVLSVGTWGNLAAQSGARVGIVHALEGSAYATGADGVLRSLSAGDQILEGDRVHTRASSRVYIVTLDQGFISLRPSSSLTIERYRVNGPLPSDKEVRFTLHQGIGRFVTGEALKAAADRFRLNTPIAAIGVRGTDFSVAVLSDATLVTVQEGVVALSPFLPSCPVLGIGACSGAGAMDLFPNKLSSMQVLPGDLKPTVPLGRDRLPDVLSPPTALEEHVRSQVSSTADRVDAVQELRPPLIRSQPKAAENQGVVANASPPGDAGVTTDLARRLQAPEMRVHWGRWQGFNGSGEDLSSAAFGPDQGTRFLLGPYAVARDLSSPPRPTTGSFTFQLKDSEAYLVSESNAEALERLNVQNPALTIDFLSNRFFTSLDLISIGEGVIPVRASGSVTSEGLLYSDYLGSDTTLRGVVSGDDQAGYVFHKAIQGKSGSTPRAAVGATRWVR